MTDIEVARELWAFDMEILLRYNTLKNAEEIDQSTRWCLRHDGKLCSSCQKHIDAKGVLPIRLRIACPDARLTPHEKRLKLFKKSYGESQSQTGSNRNVWELLQPGVAELGIGATSIHDGGIGSGKNIKLPRKRDGSNGKARMKK